MNKTIISAAGILDLTFPNDVIKYLQMNTMPAHTKTEKTWHNHEPFGLIVLIFVACVLGIYLIISTVLISKDGVIYIEQAKLFECTPATVLEGNTPGYPILLFAAQKFVGLFGDNSSLRGWIYTAQAVTLLCRLLALIALYLIGKRLVGPRNSFYATLILILLPYPAYMSCELTREWPYVLFLATGFLLLLWGASDLSFWLFGAVGMAAGLGHIIRPEGAQLLAFGVLWLLFKFVRSGRNLSRAKAAVALVALLIGFSIAVAPYALARGRIMPDKVRELLLTSCELKCEGWQPQAQRSPERSRRIGDGFLDHPHPDKRHRDEAATPSWLSSADLLSGLGESIYELCERISENLLYFFVPPMLIGFYLHFRGWQTLEDAVKFFVPAFIAFNIITLILLHRNYGYMSRRHALPVVLIGVFYVPEGLRVIAGRLEGKILTTRPPDRNKSPRWYFILLMIGLAICSPKLLRPVGADKQGYRRAAEWLKSNTEALDVIAVPDPRISFYAERKGLIYENDVSKDADYTVMVVDDSTKAAARGKDARKVYTVSVNEEKKNGKKVVIYEMM